MSCLTKLGENTFNKKDIALFAKVSGDFNPMHVDSVFARRLITGGQTVHGMYTLLFALDLYYQKNTNVPNQIKVFLQKPILEGEFVEFFYEARFEEVHITVRNNYGQVASILLLGTGSSITTPINLNRPLKVAVRNPHFSEIKGKRGILSVMASQDDLNHKFPFVTRFLGAQVVATIMAFSRLVGMSVPGLNSIFTGMDMKFGSQYRGPLNWKVVRHISPKLPIKVVLKAHDFSAEINSFFRPPPTKQASIKEIKRVIEPHIFTGQRALIIGGSRGLGELVAKCVAVGGGDVHITYMNGKSDIAKVQNAINRIGGSCTRSRLDVNDIRAVGRVLRSFQPTHIYYFPSPFIRYNTQNYNKALYDEYHSVYVGSFSRIVRAASELILRPFYVFYPSTQFIETEQKGFAEYISAKISGEQEAEMLRAKYHHANIIVKRLPPLKTDQTASLSAEAAESPLKLISDVLLDIRNLQVE